MKKATKVRACSVPGCASSETRFMKPHAFREHVPGIFHEGLPYDDKQVNTRRVKALEQAARWLLGKPATLEDLVSFLRIQRLLDTVEHCEVSEVQRNAMIGMCKHLKAKQPEVFDLAGANSPGVLVHWKVLLLIVAVLNQEEREYWKTNFEESTDECNVGQTSRYPAAIDSHFHLDRTLNKLGISGKGSLQDILQAILVDLDEQITLVGTVAVYCDPNTFPAPQSLLEIKPEMKVAVGLHPRHASFPVRKMDEAIRCFTSLIQHPRVCALGEVGLDRTEPVRDWSSQVILLPLLQDRHVLVLHVGGWMEIVEQKPSCNYYFLYVNMSSLLIVSTCIVLRETVMLLRDGYKLSPTPFSASQTRLSLLDQIKLMRLRCWEETIYC